MQAININSSWLKVTSIVENNYEKLPFKSQFKPELKSEKIIKCLLNFNGKW